MARIDWIETRKPTPSSVQRELIEPNSAVLRSALSAGTQRIVRAGAHWRLTVTWGPLTIAEAGVVLGFLTELSNLGNSTGFHTFDYENQGAFGGTAMVDGAGQTGNQLNIKGMTPSVTGWAKAGDFFSIRPVGSRFELKRFTSDLDSDGSGNGVAQFWPPMRLSPEDDRPLDVGGTITGEYLLDGTPVVNTADAQGNHQGPNNPVQTITVVLTELV